MSEKYICGLIARRVPPHRIAFLVIVLAITLCGTGLPAHGRAYLAVVGPPSLRFGKMAAFAQPVSWTPPPLPVPETPPETNLPPETPTNSTDSVALTPPTSTPSKAPVLILPQDLSTNSPAPPQSANDLLPVTPEMLLDYFKLDHAATNSATVHVVAPVRFAPPTPVPMPSSQAIYRSQ